MGSLVENSPRFCPWKFRAYGNAQQRGAGATPSPWSDYRVFIQTVRGEVSVPSLCAQVAFPLRPALPSIQADLSTSASSEQPKQPSVPAFVDKVFFLCWHFRTYCMSQNVLPREYLNTNIQNWGSDEPWTEVTIFRTLLRQICNWSCTTITTHPKKTFWSLTRVNGGHAVLIDIYVNMIGWSDHLKAALTLRTRVQHKD